MLTALVERAAGDRLLVLAAYRPRGAAARCTCAPCCGSRSTVAFHLSNGYAKTGTTTRHELVQVARR